MKRLICPAFLVLCAVAWLAPAQAQERIYRCGNEYTNNAAEAKSRGCKVVEGASVTVVSGTKPGAAVKVAAAPAVRSDASEQRSRDAEARVILDAELKKAEARQAELQKEYNNGEPEKQGAEARNYQKYLDRVAEIKASLARNESDIAGLKRELARLPATTATATSPAPAAPSTALR
ncbi:MAG: hypothetical protein ACKVIH_12060 [Burkholderiales bacterium]